MGFIRGTVVLALLLGEGCSSGRKANGLMLPQADEKVTDEQLLASERKQFGDLVAGSIKGVIVNSCDCNVDGVCRRLVPQAVIDTRLEQSIGLLNKAVPRAFPRLFAELMSTDTGQREIGEQMGRDSLNRLSPEEKRRWLTMVMTCVKGEGPSDEPEEFSANAVYTLVTGCQETATSPDPAKTLYCGCLADGVIAGGAAKMKQLTADVQRNSLKSIEPLIATCGAWVQSEGTKQINPFAKFLPVNSTTIIEKYDACHRLASIKALPMRLRVTACNTRVSIELNFANTIAP